MIKAQQASTYLQQLQAQYPEAFKRNFLFFAQLKTKGILDELKEIIPWILAILIFVSSSFLLGMYIEDLFPIFNTLQSRGIAILGIMLLFMLTVPFIIRQIKHSSIHLYQQLSNTPLKLAVLIILQAVNIAYVQSALLQGVLFFFALSFGFVKFYKENMYRENTQDDDFYHLQQIRRICYWSYKKAQKTKRKMKFENKNSEQYKLHQTQLTEYLELHIHLLKFENELSKTYKFVDLDAYIDSMM